MELPLIAPLLLLLLFCCCSSPVRAVSFSQLYPFGPPSGDQTLESGDDVSSEEIDLRVNLVFYNTSYRAVYVNSNGLLSFETEVPDYRADLYIPMDLPIIAIFLADVDTRATGRVYYRSTSEVGLLQRAAIDIRNNFSGFESYVPSLLFIVTWDMVGYYPERADKLNTFQLILATDGRNTFATFNYLDEGIEWTSSEGKFQPTFSDIPPQAGFDRGQGGIYHRLPGSAESGSFVTGSNVNVPGVWMFHIGNTDRGNVRPADLSIGEVTLFEVPSDKQSCFQATNVCHKNAQCVDHATGVCCVCLPPYTGNGLHCLEPGVPQKLNGPVTGILNGVPLDNVDLMHTYVVTADGRTYSAISRVPPSLGPSLQTLNSIAGIIGWLFAVPMNGKAHNGYSFTGGVFNRTARITFKSTDRGEYVVRLQQIFYGHEKEKNSSNIRMSTRLDGDMPEIPIGAIVSIDDYQENYKRTAPGTIKSFVARTYKVNDVAYQYSWDNTITFNECQHGDQSTNTDVMRLSVARHYVKHSEQDNVVRYAMTSKVGIFAGVDPCSEAAKNCADTADCVPYGDSYRCVCRTGFAGSGRTCEDVDECRLNPCDRNAQCLNIPGSFQCRCLPGFSGDGRLCKADSRQCGDSVCDNNAQCVYLSGRSQPVCECRDGFRGDGLRCSPIEVTCDKADICGENAACVFDRTLQQYFCECMDEFSGDGYSCEPTSGGCVDCDRFAQCVRDVSRNVYMCQCDAGYTGDGHRCTRIDTCADCDYNARCLFNEETSDYECVCVRGYRGDGRQCQLMDCREDPGMCHLEGGICWNDPERNLSICRCNYGYRGNGFDCRPVGCDEVDDCDSNARCLQEDGRYQCRCNEGYEGDGRRCSPGDFRKDPVRSCYELNNCDVNARCVPDAADPTRYACRCNPSYHGDGYVCLLRVVSCNQVNNCDRNAECLYDPDIMSYTCRCSRGFEGDGLTCARKEIIDCRRNPALCSANAQCIPGAEEGYVCVCHPGYRGDGTSCSPIVREGNYLIYAQGSKVLRVATDASSGDRGQQLIYIPGMLAVGVDTDCHNGDIYWTDASKGIIRRAQLNGSSVETLINDLKSPEGVAVDFAARNLFYTDSELDVLKVARLDGTFQKTLVDTDMVNPRAIVLDIYRGVVYWTDWNRNQPQIERINMDGTQRQVLVQEDLRLPNGLAFDTFSETLCWGDAGTHAIECIRSDGVGRRVVYDKAPYPFDVVVFNNVVYWTDWERKNIPNINQNGGEPNQPLKFSIGGQGRAYGITAVKDQCPRARNSCALNNGGCKFLCLPTANGGRVCSCPDDTDPRICQQ